MKNYQEPIALIVLLDQADVLTNSPPIVSDDPISGPEVGV